eukprot:353069-Chlamydomonas_euryale.AAC.29
MLYTAVGHTAFPHPHALHGQVRKSLHQLASAAFEHLASRIRSLIGKEIYDDATSFILLSDWQEWTAGPPRQPD